VHVVGLRQAGVAGSLRQIHFDRVRQHDKCALPYRVRLRQETSETNLRMHFSAFQLEWNRDQDPGPDRLAAG